MANIESERRQQCQNSNVAPVQKYLQTLQNFVTSDNEVYMFEDNMPDEECAIVDQLCQNMGLGSQFIGRENGQILSVYKIKEEDSNLAVTPKKRKKEEKPELPQHQNPIVDESTRIRISQILESFLASNDEGEDYLRIPNNCFDIIYLFHLTMLYRLHLFYHEKVSMVHWSFLDPFFSF